MTKANRPKLLIIGHARHGKDTVAEMLHKHHGFKFASSSEYVGRKAIWPMWGQYNYSSFEEMFEDRVNHRELWSNLINAYNTPDKAKTGKGMIEEDGLDLYVGMRSQDEYIACMEANLFDFVIWVDRSGHLPPEDNPKMTMLPDHADFIINNNGTLEDLFDDVEELVRKIKKDKRFYWTPTYDEEPEIFKYIDVYEGFDREVGYPEGCTKIDEFGYVYLPPDGVFGTDEDIVTAARVSYGQGTKKVSNNEALINYLYLNKHTSPFEMVEMKFEIHLPIFVMRQLVRHRTANLNEYSGRYSVMPDLWYTPESENIKGQDKTNKQGSDAPLTEATQTAAQNIIEQHSIASFRTYHNLLDMGVSREMARIVLPLNTYTKIVWKMDLNNLLKFLTLRDDPHAQPEIQAYARVIGKYVEQHFPLTYAAYLQVKNGVFLTTPELYALVMTDPSALSKSQKKKHGEIQDKIKDWMMQHLDKPPSLLD